MNTKIYSFKAPWDLLLIILTIVLCLFLLGLNLLTTQLIPTLFALLIIFGSAAFGIYGYRIEKGKLRIIRLGWSTFINLDDIKEVKFVPNAMKGSIRIFGIGGLFAYVGNFKNRLLSNYKAYATHRRLTVVITTHKNEAFVITPDHPNEFLEVMKTVSGSKIAIST